MSRSYTSQSLIQLPILSAAEAAVLVTQILTAATAARRACQNSNWSWSPEPSTRDLERAGSKRRAKDGG